jgi:EpsI family protein
MSTGQKIASAPFPAVSLGHWHHVLAGLLMLGCLALSFALKPGLFWSDQVGVPDLEKIIPHSFGDWVQSEHGSTAVINPQQEETLKNIYTATLARVYIHKPTGRQLMLSIAYGRDQTRDTQLHRPEMCYRSQGFRVEKLDYADVKLAGLNIPATRLDTSMGIRREPVTYWIRVGDELSRGSLNHNLVRMRFAAKGYIADGLLFRVSEVTKAAPQESYRLQDQFVESLLNSMTPAGRADLVGKKVT